MNTHKFEKVEIDRLNAESQQVLRKAVKITPAMGRDPKWEGLYRSYRSINCTEKTPTFTLKKNPNHYIYKALYSIRNAILYQQRVYFLLTRDATKKLLLKDPNWQQDTGFNNSEWREILSCCYNTKLFKRYNLDNDEASYIYEVIDPEFLKMLPVEKAQLQLEEIQESLTKKLQRKSQKWK